MHSGEVYKGLLRKGEGIFILSRGWVIHAKVTSNEQIEFRYIIQAIQTLYFYFIFTI